MDAELINIVSILVLASVLAGLLSGLLGVGGGIVIVPVLLSLFQYMGIALESAMPLAVGTSLLVIVANGASSSRSHMARGNCDIELLRRISPFIVVGALLGFVLSNVFGATFSSTVFGVIAFVTALKMLLFSELKSLRTQLPSLPVLAIAAVMVASVSVIMGIGGGSLTVPLLTLCGYSGHRAVGTAAVVGLLLAIPGALVSLVIPVTPADAPWGSYGNVSMLGAALIIPISALIAPLGVRLGSRLSSTTLRRLMVGFMFTGGLRVVIAPFL
jgi:uncharacterized membrane protein YfcA